MDTFWSLLQVQKKFVTWIWELQTHVFLLTLDKLSYRNFSGVDYKCAVLSCSESGPTAGWGGPENPGDDRDRDCPGSSFSSSYAR